MSVRITKIVSVCKCQNNNITFFFLLFSSHSLNNFVMMEWLGKLFIDQFTTFEFIEGTPASLCDKKFDSLLGTISRCLKGHSSALSIICKYKLHLSSPCPTVEEADLLFVPKDEMFWCKRCRSTPSPAVVGKRDNMLKGHIEYFLLHEVLYQHGVE